MLKQEVNGDEPDEEKLEKPDAQAVPNNEEMAILPDGMPENCYHSSPPSHVKVKPQFCFLKFIKSNKKGAQEDGETDDRPEGNDSPNSKDCDPSKVNSSTNNSREGHVNNHGSASRKNGGKDRSPNKNTDDKKLLTFVKVWCAVVVFE